MKLAAAGIFGEVTKDPVCGMDLDLTKAKSGSHKIDYRGQTYYFCCEQCQGKFHQAPERYIAGAEQEPVQESQDRGHGKAQTLTAPAKALDPLPGQTPEGQGEKSLPSRPMAPEMLAVTRDAVCKMDVREPLAKAVAPKTVYHGTTYYFSPSPASRRLRRTRSAIWARPAQAPGRQTLRCARCLRGKHPLLLPLRPW